MREVIRIPKSDCKKEGKPIELTHYLDKNGWEETRLNSRDSGIYKIVYLGECIENGDMFAVYICDFIVTYKGRLNSGKY